MVVKNDLINKAEEINLLAFKGEPLEDGCDLAEQLLYLSLRKLYFLYSHEQITKAEAKKQKQSLVSSFVDTSYNIELYRVQAERHHVFSKHFQEIKNNGCEVCKKLNNILCGLEK